jgi:undecaprenyl-diphosphatase
MSVLEAVILGVAQGATEFLPVSSSGHLAVLEHLWKLPEQSRLPLTVMLHGATTLAVIVYFLPRLVGLLLGLWARDRSLRSASLRTLGFILVASIPAGVAGLALGEMIERAFSSPLLIGLMLFVTGGVLFGTRYARRTQVNGWVQVLLVGVCQAIAILPGISRSGSTIAGGLYFGMERKQAFEFSFLLAIPAVAGAFLLEARKVSLAGFNPAALAAGLAAAFASGLGAIYLLHRVVTGQKLYLFGLYCWVAGLATILFVR